MKDFNKFREAWFRGVYQKYFPELYFYLRTFTVNETDIQDIIQDSFLKLLENDRLESVANIRAYLYSCVRNALLNKIGDDRKKERLKIEMERERSGHESEPLISREQLLSLTEEAIGKLPPVCKAIFKMSKIDGLSYKGIAERLNLSVKTVEAQMGIAFRKIREYVAVATFELIHDR
ncbi:MAG: RNA polymerase sigma-70 factor [Bacteroidales bacterium]|nr:RNA polymerase sigma-70 factor [Bacteroidales bacterium]MBQ6184725.1 RNA polymerase sigma-70 factor [Bacteroidales bacterium]